MHQALTIQIAEGFQHLPSLLGGFKSRDFTAATGGRKLDGLIRVDGAFALEDGTWNPGLCGWVGLVEFYGDRTYTVRFDGGRVVEVRRGLYRSIVDLHPLRSPAHEWVRVPVVMLDRL